MPLRARQTVANVLGIKLQDEDPFRELDRPGASMMSDRTDHTFVEEPPLVVDYLRGLIPSGQELYEYSLSLFPFLSWMGHYNLQWLIGDLVAGKHKLSTFLEHGNTKNTSLTGHPQVSPLAPLSSPRAWPTPNWLISRSNSVSTLPSWAFWSIGSLQPPRISLLA